MERDRAPREVEGSPCRGRHRTTFTHDGIAVNLGLVADRRGEGRHRGVGDRLRGAEIDQVERLAGELGLVPLDVDDQGWPRASRRRLRRRGPCRSGDRIARHGDFAAEGLDRLARSGRSSVATTIAIEPFRLEGRPRRRAGSSGFDRYRTGGVCRGVGLKPKRAGNYADDRHVSSKNSVGVPSDTRVVEEPSRAA